METMIAEENETRRSTPLRAHESVGAEPTTSRPSDEVSIFSAPGMEVVMQWWVESNARWSRQSFGEIGQALRQAENRL